MASPTYFPEGNTPAPFDTLSRSLQKINGALYDVVVATIAFYPEDCAPAPFDPIQRSLVKINGLIAALGAVVGAVIYSGNGDPNGVVTASVPAIYVQLDAPGVIWSKVADSGGNTGWTVNSSSYLSGTGSPEGVVTAVVGQLYVQTDSPGVIWMKVSGVGNTGWAVNS